MQDLQDQQKAKKILISYTKISTTQEIKIKKKEIYSQEPLH